MKKMLLLTNEQQVLYENTKICYIYKKIFQHKYTNDKIIVKLKSLLIILVNTDKIYACCICNLKYSIPKNIPVVFHDGLNYDYQFIIKELAKEFDGGLHCLGENAGKSKRC